ncbi:ParB/RepB/Spo0J family partition protein [bacterium]|nr:ParB/RepB/Spo0J family partition protein [bacterium]
METKKRALGRGLEELFNNENLNLSQIEESVYETARTDEIVELDLDTLRANPYQPRKIFDDDALQELADSIKEHGVFQPIIVKKSIKGYEIIAGERRYRASKLAGKKTIPAIIRNFSDEEMMEIALLENLQRENLTSIEEAEAYHMMLEQLHLTQEELATKVGKSRSHITNILGLLRLPKNVQTLINSSQVSMGHARILSKLEDSKQIEELANKIVSEKLSVRDVEKMTQSDNFERKNKVKREKSTNQYKYVEDLMREKLDTRVKINNKKIEISFVNDADLSRILEIIDIKE